LALAEAARRAQLEIRRQMLADVARLWPVLNFQHPDRTWPGWLRAMSAVLGRYHGQSAQAGGLYYRAARQAALGDPGDVSLVKLAAAPADQWVTRALGYSAVGVYRKQTVDLGRAPDVAARAALTQTLGTSARIVQDGSRTTVVQSVHADDKAVGWYRITDGDPCAFCALMASRGIAYKDGKTAGRNANRRFEGEGEFKFHNDCGCTSAPAFSRDQELPAISREADRIYRSGNASLADFRKAWRGRATASTN
jgi:hypothetical protein